VSKFASFAEYPKRSLAGAEAALLTAWASLSRYHDHLVLVGGLAVKYLTRPGAGLLPGPVTMDVDLGVTLGAEGGQESSRLKPSGWHRSWQMPPEPVGLWSPCSLTWASKR